MQTINKTLKTMYKIQSSDFIRFLRSVFQQTVFDEHLTKMPIKYGKVKYSFYNHIQGMAGAHRCKTLRSFNSFLKRESKLDTTAILTVSR